MLDLKTIFAGVWAMDAIRLEVLHRHLTTVRDWPSPAQVDAGREAAAQALRQVKGRVAVLPVCGVIEQRYSALSYFFGGCSTDETGLALDAFLANPQIDAVVLDVDSPGGSIYGVGELADKIYQARGRKPIYAVANSMAASAAYWIGSAAGNFICTPGGEVGSIGVFAMHADYSGALEAQGIKVTIAKAGRYKAEFSPYAPLSSDARDYLQERVDGSYTDFVKAVAQGRGVSPAEVRGKFGGGRSLDAATALEAGMIDRIATLDDVLGKLTGNPAARAGRPMASAEQQQRRAALEQLRAAELARLAFVHNSKVAEDEPSWGGIDKTALPRMAFADQGQADEKSTWSYPHHWVSGGSEKSDAGVYTNGTLYLHREGLNAAWAAAQGAHTGKKASAAVIAHLQKHRDALGLED